MKRILLIASLLSLAAQAPIHAESQFVNWAIKYTPISVKAFANDFKKGAAQELKILSAGAAEVITPSRKALLFAGKEISKKVTQGAAIAVEGIQAARADVRKISEPAFARVAPVIEEFKKSPALPFFAGLFASSVASSIVNSVIEANNGNTKLQLENLKWQLDGCRFNSSNQDTIHYIGALYIPNMSLEFYKAVAALKIQFQNPANSAAVEFARNNLYVIADKELRGLQGWLPSLTFAGGAAASALVAAHKAGVLPKISIQFVK